MTSTLEGLVLDGLSLNESTGTAQRTNLATNPKAGAGLTTGWTNTSLTTFAAVTLGSGGAPAADAGMTAVGLTTGFHGVGDANNDRAATSHPVVSGRTYTWSVYVYLSSLTAVSLRLQAANSLGAAKSSELLTVAGVTWTRMDVTFTADETATWELRLTQIGVGAADFYWTGALIEESAVTGTYFDGTTAGYTWSGTPHASTSIPASVIQLDAFTPPISKKRPEWIEAADSDGALLARDPLVSNGQATIKLAIAGASRDDAQTIIGQIVDKLEEADRNPLGIPLVWTPSGSTPQLTFYVLTGEVTDLPVDWESGYMANQPSVTITLDCLPYGYMDPITVTGTATAGPLVTLDLPSIPGDVPGLGRLIITDASGQSRRTVEWGAEHRYYNPSSPWPLVLDSDSLVTSGFAGTQTTLAGAYDPGATGNSIIASTVATTPQAVCGTGAQPHIGTFRVKCRINSSYAGATNLQVRLAWRVGDGSYTTNDPVSVTTAVQDYYELDMGLITIPEASLGTQSWDGQIEAWRIDGSEGIYVDYLMLIPVEAGYGKATASYAYTPGVIVARDDFTGTTAAAALNARVAVVGGTWATSGAATDFTFVDTVGGSSREAVSRTSSGDVTPRFGILGSTNYTNVEVQAAIRRSSKLPGEHGVVARWTDASNYLRGSLIDSVVGASFITTLTLTERVAGVDAILATVTIPAALSISSVFYTLRLVVFTSGRALLWLFSATGASTIAALDATSARLATGGTLATGKPGILDSNTSGAGNSGFYDDIAVSTPAAEPIALYASQSMEIRHDDTIRESSAGGTWGRPASYRGGRFKVNPAGDADRTTRVAVKASRNDLSVSADLNLTDQLQVTATITPRCSVIPRP